MTQTRIYPLIADVTVVTSVIELLGYEILNLGVDKDHYKELLRKYNIAFLNKNKTEMSKLEKEMKQWRAMVR